jgi:multidrug resistance efflux pump
MSSLSSIQATLAQARAKLAEAEGKSDRPQEHLECMRAAVRKLVQSCDALNHRIERYEDTLHREAEV